MNQRSHSILEEWKQKYPEYFKGVKVLELGSLDVNGTCRDHFEDCEYWGIDFNAGKGVDFVCYNHETDFEEEYFDTLVSFNCWEHDVYWKASISHNLPFLKKGAMIFFQWAGPGTAHHCHEGDSKGEGKYWPKDLHHISDFLKQYDIKILDEWKEYSPGVGGDMCQLVAKYGDN